ncbi:MAG: hypothetical protein ACOC2N_01415 [Spirochaetota bacterium]
MLRFLRKGLSVLLMLTACTAVAVEYEDYFVGFSTELAVSSDLDASPFFPDSLTVRSLSFAATYGPADLNPFRLRGGLGWFPSQPFRLFTGVEVPIFEHLNRSRARGFGVYLLGDVGLTLPLGWTADASLAVLIPTSALGGIRLGAGINREADLLFTFSTATGAYPIRMRR